MIRDIQDSALDPDGEQTTRLAGKKGSLPRPTAAEPHLPFPDLWVSLLQYLHPVLPSLNLQSTTG